MSAERQAALRMDCPNGCGHSWWTVGDDSYACASPLTLDSRPAPLREALGRLVTKGEVDHDLYLSDPLFHAIAYTLHQATTEVGISIPPLPRPAQCDGGCDNEGRGPWHRPTCSVWTRPATRFTDSDHNEAPRPTPDTIYTLEGVDHVPTTSRENTIRGEGPTAVNARKSHCIHGHEFTPENTYASPSGRRVCRACRIEWDRDREPRKRVRDRSKKGGG